MTFVTAHSARTWLSLGSSRQHAPSKWQGHDASALRPDAHTPPMVATAPRTTQPTKQSAAQHQHAATDHATRRHEPDSTSKCKLVRSHAHGAANPSHPTRRGTWTTTTRTGAPTLD